MSEPEPSPLLEIEALDFAYPGASPLFQELSIAVNAGELLGVIGPNGAGKSTLLSLVCGLLTPRSGELRLGGRRLSKLSAKARAREVALVPQDSGASFPFTVLETVLMGRTPRLGRFGLEGPVDYAAADQAMALTGLSALQARRIDSLSGGERQRVLIARALAQETPLLLCDEASAHLDIYHQVKVYDLLWSLSHEQGRAALCVLHDLNLAAAYCDRILLLDGRGGVAALGPTTEVLRYELLTQVFQTEIWVGVNELTGALTLAPVAGRRGAPSSSSSPQD